jgi:hypothetical protein
VDGVWSATTAEASVARARTAGASQRGMSLVSRGG